MGEIEKPSHAKSNSKVEWVIEGNKTVIPENSQPSTFAVNLASRRIDHFSEDGVPHPSEDDVIEAKIFVDQNHK